MSRWLNYIGWDKRISRMSILWVSAISEWVQSNTFNKSSKKILDYGCSTFYTGEALVHHFQEVHGFDIDVAALEKAASKNIPSAVFHNNLQVIPDKYFDIIIVSSVIQYFESLDALDNFFKFSACKLKEDNNSVLVISDIIPKDYVAWKDALENLNCAIRNGILIPMLFHLCKAAFFNKTSDLLKIDQSEISSIAEKNGFKTTFLKSNLTLSRRRYSCVFTLI